MSTEGDFKVTDTDRRNVDGRRLTDEIGIDQREIAWRKDFTGLTGEDVRRLEEVAPVLDDVADDIVDEFYSHLQEYSEAIAILDSSTKSVEALKQNQRQYLTDLGQGTYDQSYFDRRARIGKIHDMLDLGPKVYLGAYSIYYEGIFKAIAEDVKQDVAQTDGGTAVVQEQNSTSGREGDTFPSSSSQHGGAATVDEVVETVIERALSVLKMINLDQQVAMDTYIHSYSSQIEAELDRQQSVAAEVDSATDELRETSEKVAESSQQISDIAGEQADGMEQVASEVSNLSATVEEVASTADVVAETSTRAEEEAKEGRDTAEDAMDTMEDVADAADEVADDVDQLQERVDAIDEIVDVIDDIAGQTNLLALNASIEAARAGEAGEGFAVVADEVKKLAEESQEQAGRIEEMVDQIQDDTGDTVESLNSVTEQVEEGVEGVGSAMDNLDEITEAVIESAEGISEVARATEDQAASTEEVSGMIDDAVEQAHQVNSEVEQVAAANQEQTASVNEISEIIQRLTDAGDIDTR